MGEKPRTIVLMSGGMNTATMLYDFLTFEKVQIIEAMIFDAGTSSDFLAARDLCDQSGVPYSIWAYDPSPVMAYTSIDPELEEKNRALLFTTIINYAVHRAELLDVTYIAGGFCEETLPITKPDLVEFCIAAGRCTDLLLEFEFPLLNKSKAQIFELAKDLNKLVEVVGNSTSCDENDDSIQHPWGHGCGSCRGCVARWHAWDEYLQIIGQGPNA